MAHALVMFVEAFGHRLHVVVEGAGDLTVVLLHGTPTNSQVWRNVVPELAKHARVVAPDLLGFGASDKPTDVVYDLPTHAAHLKAVLEALSVDRYVLVAMDLGLLVGLHHLASTRLGSERVAHSNHARRVVAAGRMISIDAHPLLEARCFVTTFPKPLGELGRNDAVMSLLSLGAQVPMTSDDAIRSAVRELLRHGGYKPTGRGKPASEYLVRAVGEGALNSINVAVDACNVVSLHSGLPISVVDLSLASPPFRIGLATEGTSYVFNQGGQTIDVAGLLCLFDSQGPCANAVKDSQRTKTTPQTTKTLSVVWGTTALAGRAQRTMEWYRQLLEATGATTSDP